MYAARFLPFLARFLWYGLAEPAFRMFYWHTMFEGLR
jgi:hypothetical protein